MLKVQRQQFCVLCSVAVLWLFWHTNAHTHTQIISLTSRWCVQWCGDCRAADSACGLMHWFVHWFVHWFMHWFVHWFWICRFCHSETSSHKVAPTGVKFVIPSRVALLLFTWLNIKHPHSSQKFITNPPNSHASLEVMNGSEIS